MSDPLPETRPSKLTTAIVVADCAFVNGGNGQVALSTAVALAQSGVETTLFASSGPVAPALLDVPHLTIVCLDQPEVLNDPSVARGAMRGLWNFRAAGELRNVLRACDPATTVVHLHSWSKALSSSVARAALDAKFPVVVTIHDYFTFCPNGSLYDHEKQEPCTLVPMSVACAAANCDPRNRAHKAYRVARQFIAERIAGLPSGIENFICVSAFSRAIAQPHLGKARIFEVANPIEATAQTPVDVRKNDEFVYIGRLSREKGADVFAEAAAIAGVKAAFVGDGPLDETMRKLAPEAEFTGWLQRSEVRARLERARALVLPSRWYEASPLVVPEASSMGIPSIVSDSCAASRSIIDGVSGLTFRSGDAGDLAKKLTALGDPRLASLLGNEAYKRFWAAPPLMSDHLSTLREVYETILTGQR